MEESNNTKKIVISSVVVLLLGLGAYFLFFNSKAPVIELDQFGNPVQAQVVGQDLIDLLTLANSITLNDAIFSSAIFSSLNDYAVTLQPQPALNSNPFAPFPGSRASSGASPATTPAGPALRRP
jgi:hypothetical protein